MVAKLTERQVRALRQAARTCYYFGFYSDYAYWYGVSHTTIRRAVQGITWRDLEE